MAFFDNACPFVTLTSMNADDTDLVLIDGYWLPLCARVCNCCQCGVLLLGDYQPPWPVGVTNLPGFVDLRINGRPYCATCVRDYRRPDGTRPGAEIPETGGTLGNNWYSEASCDNVVRALEEDR